MSAKLSLATAVVSLCLNAYAMDAKVAMEEFMVPAADPGISLYVRNKHPEGVSRFRLRFGTSTYWLLPLKRNPPACSPVIQVGL